MSERTGDFILTFTGKQFWVTDPSPDDICIEDIAHALSNIGRFTGHSTRFYSVAEHSIYVANNVPPSVKAWGLMHDAAEAYIGDVSRPLKRSKGMEGYAAIERSVLKAIFERFGLHHGGEGVWLPTAIKEADNRILMTEKRDLMPQTEHVWKDQAEPYDFKIPTYVITTVESDFLKVAASLGLK